MVDSIKLQEIARDRGWNERVAHFLVKKAADVLDEASPDANELALAKGLAYPTTTEFGARGREVVERFSRALVTVTAVASALAPDFDHLAFTDAQFETQVNALWTTFAKSVS